MKMWEALDKAIKGLKVNFKGVERNYQLTIEDDPFIIIKKEETKKFFGQTLHIDVRDWEKLKNNVEKLLDKEI